MSLRTGPDALLDTSGQVEAAYKYDAFGQVAAVAVEGDAWASLTVDQWGNLTVDQWAGLPVELTSNMLAGGKKQYYLDPETELYLLGSGTNGRYYDAGIGRFVSEDPIRQAGEDPNLFGYVQNDPINKLDPSGHDQASDDSARKQQEERDRQQQAKAANAQRRKTRMISSKAQKGESIGAGIGVSTGIGPGVTGQPAKAVPGTSHRRRPSPRRPNRQHPRRECPRRPNPQRRQARRPRLMGRSASNCRIPLTPRRMRKLNSRKCVRPFLPQLQC